MTDNYVWIRTIDFNCCGWTDTGKISMWQSKKLGGPLRDTVIWKYHLSIEDWEWSSNHKTLEAAEKKATSLMKAEAKRRDKKLGQYA